MVGWMKRGSSCRVSKFHVRGRALSASLVARDAQYGSPPLSFYFSTYESKENLFYTERLDRTCSYIFKEEDVVVVDVGVDNGA